MKHGQLEKLISVLLFVVVLGVLAFISASFPTSSPMPLSTPQPTPIPKGDIPERSYESFREFPYGNMDFVDEETYTFLKEAYDETSGIF